MDVDASTSASVAIAGSSVVKTEERKNEKKDVKKESKSPPAKPAFTKTSSPAKDGTAERPSDAAVRPRVFPPPSSQPQRQPQSQAGGNWEQIVPQDWVAIIQQDVQRQQSIPPQPPFSDAYLNGMPANKRRKTLHLGSPENAANRNGVVGSTASSGDGASAVNGGASTTLGSLLPDAVQRAIVASGARSTTGATAPEVARQVASSTDLQETFASSVEATIRRRLADDADFKDNPDRFPAAKKLFEEKEKGN